MDEFWDFIVERQSIYHRRMVQGELPPWTTNRVLRDYFFTNVYRELDKGTVFLIRNILKLPKDEDLLFAIMVYRLFNDIDTFRFLWLRHKLTYYGAWDWERASRLLNGREAKGIRTFTDAFTVTGVKFGGFPDKVRNICYLIHKQQRLVPTLLKSIKSTSSLKHLWGIFNDVEGFGRFLAYELAIDVNYSRLVEFSENDWVNAGPGCKRGIQWIWGARNPAKKWEDYIAYLQLHQDRFIENIGRTDEWHQVWPGYALTLRGVEHSLCEFQKYARAKYHRNPDAKDGNHVKNGTKSRSATRKYIASLQTPLPI